MFKYEFMNYGPSTTLDYVSADLSKLLNAEVVSFSQHIHGMTVLIKTEYEPQPPTPNVN